jgi:cellobiose phosphorylase
VLRYGWEKDHFIYGFTDWGEKVGSDDCAEGKMYLNPQTWAVLADIFDPIACENLMSTVERRLYCDYGYVQCAPSYTRLDDHIGRATGFVPGSVENGSVYNHGVAFKIAADCKLGRAEDAYRSLREILPDNTVLSESGVEPYAVTNMYLGPENPYEAKFAPCSWITGTAGWTYRCITEFIFGIRAEVNGLRVAPCLTKELDHVRIHRVFRGAVFDICITHAGPARMLCDGVEIEGPILPVFEPGTVHRVEVFLGQ